MHFEDLALCHYHNGPFDADEWRAPLLAIGWLARPNAFPTGHAQPELLAMLESLITASGVHYPSHGFRGQHDCDICPSGTFKRSMAARSHLNIWVPGDGVIYLAPAMITHYIGDHQYLPPAEFISAVMNCPDCGSPSHCTALQTANAGFRPPLLTEAELDAQWPAIQERRAAQRLRGEPRVPGPDKS